MSADGAARGRDAFLARALADPVPADGVLVVALPAAAVRPEALIGHGADPAVFWAPSTRTVRVGLGEALVVTGAGEARFREVRDRATAALASTRVAVHPDLPPAAGRPRLFGGFSFLTGETEPDWSAFGEARFVLPRLVYHRGTEGASVALAVPGAELRDVGPKETAARARHELDRAMAGPADLPIPRAVSTAAGGPSTAAASAGSQAAARAAWRAALASIADRIEAGDAEKIVAARALTLEAPHPPALSAVLAALGREAGGATRFLFRFGDAAFLGATPERLVARRGARVRTVALAGTAPAGAPGGAVDRLLASVKDGLEHDYVVRALADALAPLCDDIEHPAAPRVRRLRHVAHLETPFTGTLREPVHVLDLVERLHPTPAVGGWPREAALRWIAEEEPAGRGWYASPVGWFDAAGDGEFRVALRSGLVTGRHVRLFAGAGIVRGSEPDAEFAETEVKLRTMMGALGIRE